VRRGSAGAADSCRGAPARGRGNARPRYRPLIARECGSRGLCWNIAQKKAARKCQCRS
jgi:hypothetical protein